MSSSERVPITHTVRVLKMNEREELLDETDSQAPLVYPGKILIKAEDSVRFVTHDSGITVAFPEKGKLAAFVEGDKVNKIDVSAEKRTSKEVKFKETNDIDKDKKRSYEFSVFVWEEGAYAEGNSSPKIIIEP